MTPLETIIMAIVLTMLAVAGLGILSIAALLVCALLGRLRGEQS